MGKELLTFTGCGDTELPGYLWLPEGEVKAVLQITHGMTEHMGRYDALAEYLLPLGIAVAGFDLRGHGKNPGDPKVAAFGETGWADSLGDMHRFFEYLNQRFPGTPKFMLGFSLGSFLLREYLGMYSDLVDGAIIVGTGHQPGWLLKIMMGVVNGQIKKAGFDGTTDLVRKLSFGTYNEKFKPNRTDADWLVSDDRQRDAYLADPLVRRDISAGVFRELLGSMKRTGKVSAYARYPKERPVLLLSGDQDPVGDAGKGVARVYDQMLKAGLECVEFQEILDARHDVFHEESTGAAETARHCVADWLMQEMMK